MKASVNWLRSLVPGLSAPAAEIAERLTRSGLEVEEVIEFGAASADVVVAQVTKVERHPERDKLSLVTVDRGGAQQRVVCGAPNVPAPGGRVVLAPLGTWLPVVGMKLDRREIAGVASEGMLCSEPELGLVGGGGRGDGIIVLGRDVDAPVGTPLSKALPASRDVVLDIGVTPNRPDALGHVGLARELAALFDLAYAAPEAAAPVKVAQGKDIASMASVEIADTERCPHYGAAVIVDVKLGPSPDWLRYRLESLGIRAISNVVDVTNLVLMEFGHPLHAFDLAKLPGGRVLVRRARDGERLTTIDHVERKLSDDDLVITDGERPIALAGVMGGADSEIAEGSTAVLLECAYFTPRGIRRTSRRHGLHSEASHRFERGIDPEGVPDVLAHAASLMTRLCSGTAVPGSIIAGVAPEPRKRVLLRQPRMSKLLGLDIPTERARTILQRLGFEAAASEKRPDELDVVIPSFRPDVKREEDLIEEVMRVHGVDEVPATPRALIPKTGRSTPTIEDRVRRTAAELGLSEALTYGFVAPSQLEALSAPESSVRIVNPLTEDRSVMRTSMLPGLLEALRRSRRHGVANVRAFAVGRCFFASDDASASLPSERLHLAAVLAGERMAGLGKPELVDVYDAKGVALELVERVTGLTAQVRSGAPEAHPHLHPRGVGEVVVSGRWVGRFGPLHPDVLERLDVGGAAMVVEIDVAALEEVGRHRPAFTPVPTLPAVSRDLALVVSADVLAGELESVIRQAAGELCESVELFDVYSGKGVPDDHRSLAFHLVFRDPKAASDPEGARTLTDKEVDACNAQVVGAVNKLGATVRGA